MKDASEPRRQDARGTSPQPATGFGTLAPNVVRRTLGFLRQARVASATSMRLGRRRLAVRAFDRQNCPTSRCGMTPSCAEQNAGVETQSPAGVRRYGMGLYLIRRWIPTLVAPSARIPCWRSRLRSPTPAPARVPLSARVGAFMNLGAAVRAPASILSCSFAPVLRYESICEPGHEKEPDNDEHVENHVSASSWSCRTLADEQSARRIVSHDQVPSVLAQVADACLRDLMRQFPA